MAVKDHIGNEYSSIDEMCKHWDIGRSTYNRRVKDLSWDKQKALETPVKRSNLPKVDHEGNEFNSCSAMCKHWGITVKSLKKHLKTGMSLEDILDKGRDKRGINQAKECVDHEGNKFKSEREMCRYYGIAIQKYKLRLSLGWTLEEALTSKNIDEQ